jgi:small neutral amino acid transporter SnatA (MarC family)
MIPAIMGWIALVGTIGLLKPNVQKIIARVIAFLLFIVGISMIVNGISVIIPMINL